MDKPENQHLQGHLVRLRPATPADRRPIFNWLTRSDLTPQMLGLPRYPDNPATNWEEFSNDYAGYFFDGSQPEQGRCFIIEVDNQPVGQINHDKIDPADHITELDIWLSDSSFTRKGYGPDAINTLCRYLNRQYHCHTFIIAPSARNTRAVKAYQKAGFVLTDQVPEGFVPDYDDTVVMVRNMIRDC